MGCVTFSYLTMSSESFQLPLCLTELLKFEKIVKEYGFRKVKDYYIIVD